MEKVSDTETVTGSSWPTDSGIQEQVGSRVLIFSLPTSQLEWNHVNQCDTWGFKAYVPPKVCSRTASDAWSGGGSLDCNSERRGVDRTLQLAPSQDKKVPSSIKGIKSLAFIKGLGSACVVPPAKFYACAGTLTRYI